jgi:hypothetical protein
VAWFRPNQGTTSAEVSKYAWWNPVPEREAQLAELAKRIAGSEQAAAHLRDAWRHVSEAIPWSPELPPYFLGPYYLGPTHPMCADPDAALPDCFKATSQFAAHVLTEARATNQNRMAIEHSYRKMEASLLEAVKELGEAKPHVPRRCRRVFEAEELPARWLYHTARTHANFYESCRLRNSILAFAAMDTRSPEEIAEANAAYERWRAVLEDERKNTRSAIRVVKKDSRIDVHTTRDGAALAPAVTLIETKLALLRHELDVFLPSLSKRSGLSH